MINFVTLFYNLIIFCLPCRCAHGYYGYPGLLGDTCQRCECNGNIDPTMVGSCDQLTGDCQICLHNTEGPNCGRCRMGYYGTAVNGDCTCEWIVVCLESGYH